MTRLAWLICLIAIQLTSPVLATDSDAQLTLKVLRGELDFHQLNPQQQQVVQAARERLAGKHCAGCNDMCLQVSSEAGRQQQIFTRALERIPVGCLPDETRNAYRDCQQQATAGDDVYLNCLEGLRDRDHQSSDHHSACASTVSELAFQREPLITAVKAVIYRCKQGMDQ